MSVRKCMRRGRTRWVAQVVINGRERRRYYDRQDEAKKGEAGMRAELEAEAARRLEPSGACQEVPTVRGFEESFLRHQDAMNSKSEQRHKRQILRDHLLDAFGDLRLDQITTVLVDQYKSAKLKKLKPATVANHVSVIKRMLNVAHEWGMIERVPKIRQVKQDRPEFDFLDFDEAERYIEAAGEWRAFVLVAIRTGLRLGELRGLRWGDVDLDHRRIRVARAFTQTGWETPKSGRGRTVDLSTDAVATLTELKPKKASRTALVFPGPSGEPLDEKAVYKACGQISEAAEVGRMIGPHKLRHTFASHHAMRGTPMPVLQAWMGHASLVTTMRYAHLAPSAGAAYADNTAANRGPRLVHSEPRSVRTGSTTGSTLTEGRETAAK